MIGRGGPGVACGNTGLSFTTPSGLSRIDSLPVSFASSCLRAGGIVFSCLCGCSGFAATGIRSQVSAGRSITCASNRNSYRSTAAPSFGPTRMVACSISSLVQTRQPGTSNDASRRRRSHWLISVAVIHGTPLSFTYPTISRRPSRQGGSDRMAGRSRP